MNLKKALIFFPFFLLFLILFLPKGWLLIKYENLLSARKDLHLCWEKLHEGLYSVVAQELTLYDRDEPIARIKRLELYPLLLYQTLRIDNLRFIKTRGDTLPTCNASHSIFDPLHPKFVCFDRSGSFGGIIDLQEGTIKIKNEKGKMDVFHFGS